MPHPRVLSPVYSIPSVFFIVYWYFYISIVLIIVIFVVVVVLIFSVQRKVSKFVMRPSRSRGLNGFRTVGLRPRRAIE